MRIFGKCGKMKINDFFRKYMTVERYQRNYSLGGKQEDHKMIITRNPYVICNDGFKMSVQVGETLYSSPKGYSKKYVEAEIGYPSEREPLLDKYAEKDFDTDCDYTDTVYPYVPIKVIDMVIEKHGGIDEVAVQSNMSENFHNKLNEKS